MSSNWLAESVFRAFAVLREAFHATKFAKVVSTKFTTLRENTAPKGTGLAVSIYIVILGLSVILFKTALSLATIPIYARYIESTIAKIAWPICAFCIARTKASVSEYSMSNPVVFNLCLADVPVSC